MSGGHVTRPPAVSHKLPPIAYLLHHEPSVDIGQSRRFVFSRGLSDMVAAEYLQPCSSRASEDRSSGSVMALMRAKTTTSIETPHATAVEKSGAAEMSIFPADIDTCVALLRWCRDSQSLQRGKYVHDLGVCSGFSDNDVFASTLVQMYEKCGAIEDAVKVFADRREGDGSSFNIVIGALARHSCHQEAFQLFEQMQQESILPNKVSFMIMLSLCGSQALLAVAMHMHVRITSRGYDSDVGVGTALVSMYGKCGSMVDASAAFDRLQHRCTISCTAMISVCAQHECCELALQIFSQMLQTGLEVDRVTFVSTLAAISRHQMLGAGRQLHACIIEYGFDQALTIVNALLHMYGKCGSQHEAQKAFDDMKEADLVSWTSLIASYAENGNLEKAVCIFEQMQKAGFSPNKVTFLTMLAMLADQKASHAGEQLHGCIIQHGYELDRSIASALISMYGKCGNLDCAMITFNKMDEHDVVSWTAIISLHTQQGQGMEALQLYQQMEQVGVVPNKFTLTTVLEACESLAALSDGKHMHSYVLEKGYETDVVPGTALVKMYSASCSLRDACYVFDKMSERDQVTWHTIIAAYAEDGQIHLSFQLFDMMQREGILPDQAIFVCLLGVCADKLFLSQGKRLHAQSAEPNIHVALATALLNMYGRCGRLELACQVFEDMLEQNVVSWTALIAVFVENDCCSKAIQVFEQMLEECILPNEVTFVNVLMACASMRDVLQGRRAHTCILSKGLRLEVTVGNALISMYGKCGHAREAQSTFDEMVETNIVSWTGLISVFAQHGQVDAVLHVFEQMLQKGVLPNEVTSLSVLDACANDASFVEGERMCRRIFGMKSQLDLLVGNSMVNMYGRCGDLNGAQIVFEKMMERDIVTWNAMMGAYADHGMGKKACQLFDQMQVEGFTPDEITSVNLLAAFSHAGLVTEGCFYFASIMPVGKQTSAHFSCMIDAFGRAGQLEAAEVLVGHMPFLPMAESFTALLGACRFRPDIARGECAAKHVYELDARSMAPLYILSHLYSAI